MAVDALAIANYFLDLAEAAGERLTPMKLQKLVYYAHGWNLALTDAPLLDEQVQAWSYGPVVREIYTAFKESGADPITERAVTFEPVPGAGPFSFVAVKPSIDDLAPEKREEIKALLDRVWEVYHGYSASQLSNMTHQMGTPWYQVWERYDGKIPKHTTIPADLIREHFKALGKQG
jgi:uncharacterized phage-associated protein